MIWINFLHIYQPPNQKLSILDRVVNESYRKIFAILISRPQAKLTLNINACLSQMLADHGYEDVINQIKYLLENKQIEMTTSGMYHPFMPLLPLSEVSRQIEHNNYTNQKIFGPLYRPQGIFPPEMGYSPQLDEVFTSQGIHWVLLDQMALPNDTNPYSIYQNTHGLKFIFRERDTSFQIQSAQIGSQSLLTQYFSKSPRQNAKFVVTAMDGETFGHHRPGLELLLDEVYASDLQTMTISELISQSENLEYLQPKESNWAMSYQESITNRPFIRWMDPDNTIHSLQWQLVQLATEVIASHPESTVSRNLLDKALHSDQFWWASCRPWWSLEMIEKGAHELLEVVTSSSATHSQKDAAKDLYFKIITLGFSWQRTGKVDKLSRQEDEEIKSRISAQKPFISPEEYDHMIQTLHSQMTLAAHNQEFIRAEQIRHRISELQREKVSGISSVQITHNL